MWLLQASKKEESFSTQLRTLTAKCKEVSINKISITTTHKMKRKEVSFHHIHRHYLDQSLCANFICKYHNLCAWCLPWVRQTVVALDLDQGLAHSAPFYKYFLCLHHRRQNDPEPWQQSKPLWIIPKQRHLIEGTLPRTIYIRAVFEEPSWQAEARAEFAERSVTKLQKEVDRLEGGICFGFRSFYFIRPRFFCAN